MELFTKAQFVTEGTVMPISSNESPINAQAEAIQRLVAQVAFNEEIPLQDRLNFLRSLQDVYNAFVEQNNAVMPAVNFNLRI